MSFLIAGGGASPDMVAQPRTPRANSWANVGCLVDAYRAQMMFLKNVKNNLGL
jgi:hypothetical protein